MAELTLKNRDRQQVPIPELDDQGLRWWEGQLRADLENPEKEQYTHSNRAKLDAVVAEIERRANGGERREPSRPQSAAAPAKPASPSGKSAITLGASIASGGNLMATLERLSEAAILIAPTLACESLPEGAEVAISMVRADTSSQDCYVTVGDRKHPKPDDTMGLGGPLLFRIAAAAGVTWLRDSTARTDDGRNPYKVGYRTWARIQDIDGSLRDFPGECEVDLTDGGPQALDIIDKASKRNRDPQKQLAEARKFIQRSTLTKAMNSAIRKALGLRHAYSREELETKPFAVAKLLFTGRTNDPDLKPLFAQIVAQRFGLAVPQLYGTQAPTHRPAVVTTVGSPVDEFGPDGAPVPDSEEY